VISVKDISAGLPVSRRTMSRRGAAILALGPLVAACIPGAGRPTGGAGERIIRGTTRREVTVRWSTWGDDRNAFNTAAAPMGMQVFNQQFPNIKVSIEPQIGADWPAKNQSEWLAGTGPDVSGHCCSSGVQWARDGLFLDLDPLLKRDIPQGIRDDFVAWLMELFHQPGTGQFALPMYSGTIALFYNKVLFRRKGIAPPDESWDWTTYRDASVKLNDPGAGVYGRRQVRGLDRLSPRLHQSGGNWVDPQDTTKAAFDRPEAMQALQYERDANLKDRSTGYVGDYGNTQGMDSWQALAAQRFTMWEDGSFGLLRHATQVERAIATQWDVAPLPKGPRRRDTLATHDGWAIWKGSKVPDESWELMKFLHSDEWTAINTRSSGQQPARKSFQDGWIKAIKEANPLLADKNLQPFTEAVRQGYARPKEFFARKQLEAERIIEELLNVAVYAAETGTTIKNGEQPLDTAVKNAARRVNDLLK
jgi:multiple sugar transport system substrate-binding protein